MELIPKTQRQREILAALQKNDFNRTATARELGVHRKVIQESIHIMQRESKSNDLVIPEPPESDLTIEEILENKRKLYARKKALQDFEKLIHITVKDNKPIAVCNIGDPHIDDDGCDIDALEKDLNTIKNTDGMYAGHLGDLTNNWIGRLARLYANQITTAKQAVKLMEWMLNYCPNLYVVNGNHDCWQNTDIIGFILRAKPVVHQSHGARLSIDFPNGKSIRINARHDFKGNSIYNPTHAHRREQLFGAEKDHIYISGHRHYDAASMIAHPCGTISWSFVVSGYKVIDDYAKEGGFQEMRVSPSVTTILDPSAPNGEMVKPFWSAEAAADYLTFLRKRK